MRPAHLVILSAVLALGGMAGCGGGGGSSGSAPGGSLNLRALWQQPSGGGAAAAADGISQAAAQTGGFGSPIPAAVQTVRVLYYQSASQQCCIALDPRSSYFASQGAQRQLVLDQLPPGSASVTVSGFATDFAPADGITETCDTDPAGVGTSCDTSQPATPSFQSAPQSVTIEAGAQGDAGDILIPAVPFVLNPNPTPNASLVSPVPISFTLAIAKVQGVTGINCASIRASITPGSPNLALSTSACDDANIEVPCSPNGSLNLTGCQAATGRQPLSAGAATISISGSTLPPAPESVSFSYQITVVPGGITPPPGTPTPTPTETQTGGPVGGISGTVVNCLTGQALADVTVTAEQPGVVAGQVVTASDGSFSFAGLGFGDYTLRSTKAGFIESTAAVAVSAGDPQPVVRLALCPPSGLRVVLTWGSGPPAPADLDAHLRGPAPGTLVGNAPVQFHLYFDNSPISFSDQSTATLDIDSILFDGPETETVSRLATGTYRFCVQDFSDRLQPGSPGIANSQARVQVFIGNAQVGDFQAPSGGGTVWEVFDLDNTNPLGAPVVVPVNTLVDEANRDRVCRQATDSDGDGLTEDQEQILGTEPNNFDTNNNGVSDGQDVIDGVDPRLPTPTPSATPELGNTATQTPTETPTETPAATPSETPTLTATETPTDTPTPSPSPTQTSSTQLAFVANLDSGTVTVIDVSTNAPINTIQGFTQPVGVALTPDATFLYVVDAATDSVTIVDTRTLAPGQPIGVGTNPFGIAIGANLPAAYVANNGSADVTVIDTRTATVSATIPVGAAPLGVAITPDGSRVYISNFEGDSVSVIDTSTNTVTTTVPLQAGSGPAFLAVTPNDSFGSFVLVPNQKSNTVALILTETNAVSPTAITVGQGPTGVAFTPDGTRAYVTNRDDGNVSVIDIGGSGVSTIPLAGAAPSVPTSVAVTPDGKSVYVVDESTPGRVFVIDTATNTVGPNPIPVGDLPQGLVIKSFPSLSTPVPTGTPTPSATPSPTSGPPQAGAIVVFENLQVSAASDPTLSLTNALPSFSISAYCFYADTTQPACKTLGFNVQLNPGASMQWQASTGAGSVPGTGIPFSGELVCVEVDFAGPVDRMDLTGSLQINPQPAVPAITVGALPGAVDQDDVLMLNGTEYEACPAGIPASRIEGCWSQSQFTFLCSIPTPAPTSTPTPTLAGMPTPTPTPAPVSGAGNASAYAPGSLLVYPYVTIDSVNGVDTVVQLSNTSASPVSVHCFYENTTAHCSNQPSTACTNAASCPAGGTCTPGWSEQDFILGLAGMQPTSWRVSQGLMSGSLSVPPAAEDPFVGVLRCVVVDNLNAPIGNNAIKGEATIETFLPGSRLDVAKYNALALPALTTGNGDQTLILGGQSGEYASCPQTVILNGFFDGAADPVLQGSSITTTLALVPCGVNYSTPQPSTVTLKYQVFNEFEQAFTAGNGAFVAQQLSSLADISRIFSASVAGTLTGQAQIVGVEGGVLGVAIEAHSGAVSSSAGLNAYGQGLRAGSDTVVLP